MASSVSVPETQLRGVVLIPGKGLRVQSRGTRLLREGCCPLAATNEMSSRRRDHPLGQEKPLHAWDSPWLESLLLVLGGMSGMAGGTGSRTGLPGGDQEQSS